MARNQEGGGGSVERVKRFANPVLSVINWPCEALDSQESFMGWSKALPDLFSSELNLVNPQWVLIFDLTTAANTFTLKADSSKKKPAGGRKKEAPARDMVEWELAKRFVQDLEDVEKFKVIGDGFSLHAVEVNVDPSRVGVPVKKGGSAAKVEVSVWECW